MGKGEEARKYFAKAIDVADTPEHKAGARRAMAMSYAFEGNCAKTIAYETQVFEFYDVAKSFFQQGEIADEAARLCLDSGDLDTASKWYQTGHETGLKEPDIKPVRQDLWNNNPAAAYAVRQEEALLAACGLHERRPNQVPRRFSDTRTPAATETLIESQPPLIGMRTRNRRDL